MINNEFYKTLADSWYTSSGDAVALLRQENRAKAPWVVETLRKSGRTASGTATLSVLDVGCGGGFLALHLAEQGFAVTGLDVSESIVEVGRRRDVENRIRWEVGFAEKLQFTDESFDAVTLMDVLEHISDPYSALAEAKRVLKPGGLLLLHTFNRNWLSWLFAAKGLEWFIAGSPTHIHDWNMFIKPNEVLTWIKKEGFGIIDKKGLQPQLFSSAFLQLLLTRRVPERFQFSVGGPLWIGYLVAAAKK